MNDWRMDAMAEFFNAEFVRIGEDGEPMNDTTETQDELVEQIQLLVSADATWYSPEDYIPMSGVEQLNIGLPATTAERIIALVRAAPEPDEGWGFGPSENEIAKLRVERSIFEALGDRNVTYERFMRKDTGSVKAAIFNCDDLERMAAAALAAAHGDADWLDDALPDSWDADIRYEGIASSTLPGLGREEPLEGDQYFALVGPWDAHAGDRYEGTGPTRKAAILDAVAKARKEADHAN